jgi:hypothetical protein
MTVCPCDKETLPRGPVGDSIGESGIMEEGAAFDFAALPHSIFCILHFFMEEESMTSGLLILSLIILSVFLKGHSFRAACCHDE